MKRLFLLLTCLSLLVYGCHKPVQPVDPSTDDPGEQVDPHPGQPDEPDGPDVPDEPETDITAGASISDQTAESLYTEEEGSSDEVILKILFIGNSFTQDAVWHLPDVLKNMGVRNVKMIDCYIGGRLLNQYNSDFSTGTTNNAYTSEPGQMAWHNVTGKTLKQICESEDWDVITLQEHTGNNVAWGWTDAKKEVIASLLDKIKATQTKKTPKFYYLMSQSYYDFAKMSGQKSYWTFSNQLEMYDVCVDFAKKAVDELGFDGIIPSGTYMQNIRTSSVNSPMDMTRDGYHMDNGLARYGAACTVYEACMKQYIGIPLGDGYTFGSNNTSSTGHATPVTVENGAVARRAVALAVGSPWKITDMGGRKTSGGISNAWEMVDFALAVNNGESLDRFIDPTTGKILLLNDIDMSGLRLWLPIGLVTLSGSGDARTVNIGHAFEGQFDGQGHVIKGLNLLCDNAIANRPWGLFGCVGSKGRVENFTLDATCSVTDKSTATTYLDAVAGAVLKGGTVSNVTDNSKK